ncbi:MAG: DedA family protein [Bacteroidales bacterium]|nr:DedA family protein [Bacteroidales bacterium]
MEWLESLGLLGLFLGSALAASIVPFSSDVLYIAILASTGQSVGCLVAATAGSWLGSLFTYYLGWLGKWEWIEKWFKITREKLEQQQAKVQKYGVWLALFSWVPIIGDVTVLALGFYKTSRGWTFLMLLIGKALRYLFWNLIVGLF